MISPYPRLVGSGRLILQPCINDRVAPLAVAGSRNGTLIEFLPKRLCGFAPRAPLSRIGNSSRWPADRTGSD